MAVETRRGTSLLRRVCTIGGMLFVGKIFVVLVLGIKYYAAVETRRGTSLLRRVCTIGGMLFVGKNIRGVGFWGIKYYATIKTCYGTFLWLHFSLYCWVYTIFQISLWLYPF